jgi:hypothetical protein
MKRLEWNEQPPPSIEQIKAESSALAACRYQPLYLEVEEVEELIGQGDLNRYRVTVLSSLDVSECLFEELVRCGAVVWNQKNAKQRKSFLQRAPKKGK